MALKTLKIQKNKTNLTQSIKMLHSTNVTGLLMLQHDRNKRISINQQLNHKQLSVIMF